MKYKGIVQKRNDDNYTTIHRMWGSSFMYILDYFSLIVFSSLITFVWSNDFIPTSRANIINIITQHMRSNMGWNLLVFVSHSKFYDLRSHGKWPQVCGWRTPPTIPFLFKRFRQQNIRVYLIIWLYPFALQSEHWAGML